MWFSVRPHYPIYHKVSIIRLISEISSVGEVLDPTLNVLLFRFLSVLLGLRRGCENALISPVPNESSLHVRILPEGLPELVIIPA